MIKLIDRGADESRIEFMPRGASLGISSKAPRIERDLLYGHTCPWCNNVIQALFLTDEPVNLSLYEETRVMSQGEKNDGTLLKFIPNSSGDGSGYKVDFYRTREGNAQLIRLKNHLVVWKGIYAKDRNDFFEVGERCCKFTGVFSRDETRAVADMITVLEASLYSQARELSIPVSFMDTYAPPYYEAIDHRVVPAVGKATPVLLVPRERVKDGDSYRAQCLITNWKEKAEAEEALV